MTTDKTNEIITDKTSEITDKTSDKTTENHPGTKEEKGISAPLSLGEGAGERLSGAEALMLALKEEGVKTIFGYPGGSIMPVFDALYDYTRG